MLSRFSNKLLSLHGERNMKGGQVKALGINRGFYHAFMPYPSIIRGDITGWARGNHNPAEPAKGKLPKQTSGPVSDLAAIRNFHARQGKAPEGASKDPMVFQHESAIPSVSRDMDKTLEIADVINRRFSNFGRFQLTQKA